MRNAAFLQRANRWFFTTLVFVGASMMIVSSASAQAPPPFNDHLKCYQTKDFNPEEEERIVGLINQQFGQEECKLVTKAQMLCAPTTKNNLDDPLGGLIPAQDYLCYKIKCTPRRKTTHKVSDQFGDHLTIVGDAQLLCAPAEKSQLQPLVCGDTAPLCSGTCPPNQKCHSTAAGCACH